jgi:hypothetical protein
MYARMVRRLARDGFRRLDWEKVSEMTIEADYKLTWFYRSHEPAQSPADPRFPRGVTVDLRPKGVARFCTLPLKWPAPGVGSWLIECNQCGFTGVVTAAGRTDDPRSVHIPCKKWVDTPAHSVN